MIHLENSPAGETIEGVYTIQLHSDQRILIPKAWREHFPDTSESMLFFDGTKIIVVPSTKGAPPEGIIVHRTIVKDGRIRPSRAFYKSHQITQPEKVWLIGKGNHFEILLSETSYQELIKKSQELVLEFQKKLLRAKGE